MAQLQNIVTYLDQLLKTDEIADYSGALNGLQIENRCGDIARVVSAVDASLPVIKKAIEKKADLLIVHHGIFWHAPQRHVGANYEKLKLCIDNNLAIYSSHLPLDIHPAHGNNHLLAEMIGLKRIEPFGNYKGHHMGLKGEIDLTLTQLLRKLETDLDKSPHHCGAYGEELGVVGIITGGAGSEIGSMPDHGIDTLITGEGPHWSFCLAEELNKNLIYAGHYATETFGVRSLGKALTKEFMIDNHFIDHPTGL